LAMAARLCGWCTPCSSAAERAGGMCRAAMRKPQRAAASSKNSDVTPHTPPPPARRRCARQRQGSRSGRCASRVRRLSGTRQWQLCGELPALPQNLRGWRRRQKAAAGDARLRWARLRLAAWRARGEAAAHRGAWPQRWWAPRRCEASSAVPRSLCRETDARLMRACSAPAGEPRRGTQDVGG
jgi:hypothetical protein